MDISFIWIITFCLLDYSHGYRSHEADLRKFLLEDYDTTALPGPTSHVSVGFAVIHYDMNEAKESLDLDLWIIMGWTDPRLKWNSTLEKIEKLSIPPNLIWRPDLTIYNNAEHESFDPYARVSTVVMSNGDVMWIPPAHVKTMCILDMTYWPYDTHNCTVNFGSWVHSSVRINLTLKSEALSFEHVLVDQGNIGLKQRGEWQVVWSRVMRRTTKYECCPEEYHKIQLSIMVTRNSPAFRWIIQVPCAVLSILTVAIFLLPPSAGEKITFGAIVLIMDLFFLLGTSQVIGHSPSHTPIIIKFISTQLVLTCTSIVLSSLMLSMARSRQTISLPRYVLRPLEYLSRSLCFWSYPTLTIETAVSFARTREDGIQLDEDLKTVDIQSRKEWLLLVAVMDRFCLILFCFIFVINLITYCQVL